MRFGELFGNKGNEGDDKVGGVKVVKDSKFKVN